jgi:hypothetical protein
MKFNWLAFFLLYILVPVILIPLYCIKSGNWYGLFGLIFYFAGLVISQFKQWIFLPIPILFCGWYWFTYGFTPTNFVSLFFLCLMAGVALSEASLWYQSFVHKILPEQLNNIEYDAKVAELERRLEEYRQKNPGQNITQDVVEKIRTEVFFK